MEPGGRLLPSTHVALGSNLSTTKKKQANKKLLYHMRLRTKIYSALFKDTDVDDRSKENWGLAGVGKRHACHAHMNISVQIPGTHVRSWAWQFTPASPALRRWRQGSPNNSSLVTKRP